MGEGKAMRVVTFTFILSSSSLYSTRNMESRKPKRTKVTAACGGEFDWIVR